ncbi:uncharacterized protein FTOL_00172 [Fusarium torulosum]|uniref:Uncharacterized protein n=1 Tax=Fusarium torulosum TaxID=33205 RepID=A0AAE8LXL1_9HYPO|nr:uncharacterized protein FTOL_00172 [Fusarium torulosum]
MCSELRTQVICRVCRRIMAEAATLQKCQKAIDGNLEPWDCEDGIETDTLVMPTLCRRCRDRPNGVVNGEVNGETKLQRNELG